MNRVVPLYGLVLAGGASQRMGRDKAMLQYPGRTQTQLHIAYELLRTVCAEVYISVRAEQHDVVRATLPQIVDRHLGCGPLAGIAAAQAHHSHAAWLVLACDLPFVTAETLRYLVQQRDAAYWATAFRSSHDGLPEPLCAIWEPISSKQVQTALTVQQYCPRKLLLQNQNNIVWLALPQPHVLDNINTPAEYSAAQTRLRQTTSLTLQVHYFAVLREQAGKSNEVLTTTAQTPAAVYAALCQRYPFTLTQRQLQVAVNDEFADWDMTLSSDDRLVFVPPVSGG